MTFKRIYIIAMSLCLAACQPKQVEAPGQASIHTIEANTQSASRLNFTRTDDFDNAQKGLIARATGVIYGPDNKVLIDFDEFDFVYQQTPDTVHPSLWRHAQLNSIAGLFKVTEGIYQIRGFDLANLTIIEGEQGWIVVDPLTSEETAAAAIAFARSHLTNKPITAVIYTHSHVDHFGGVLGIIDAQQQQRQAIPIVAPQGFMEEATSENVLVGPAMARRSIYQFGKNLPANVTGLVDTGLGKRVGYGTIGILPPTHIISEPNQSLVLDGVEFIFHNTPGAEAPAELTFNIPSKQAYGGAELLSQTMHNFLPIRGAKVRDVLQWTRYLQAALDQLGDAQVYFGQHNWPVWGNHNIAQFITMHRDVYKYLHDQTVRLINAGYTANEIVEQVVLPKPLAEYFSTRGYYGDPRHNIKAIYQYYLGAYDGNPANLDPLPPAAKAQKYIELAGGAEKVIGEAAQAFQKGEYRWAAELLNHIMFDDSDNRPARQLLIDTYQQLAYQSESATWRNSYLTAAQELQYGIAEQSVNRATLFNLMLHTPTERFLEAMAASVNGANAEGTDLAIQLRLSDTDDCFELWLSNAVMHFQSCKGITVNATIEITKPLFVGLLAGTVGARQLITADDVSLSGSTLDFIHFMSLIEPSPATFAIVTDE